MKKGGVVQQAVAPAKRRRAEGAANNKPISNNPSGVTRWRMGPETPQLGGASKDWELPDVEAADLSIATSWDAANAAATAAAMATKKMKESQPQFAFAPIQTIEPTERWKAAPPPDEPPNTTTSGIHVQGGFGGSGMSVGAVSAVTASTGSSLRGGGFGGSGMSVGAVSAVTASTGSASRTSASTITTASSMGVFSHQKPQVFAYQKPDIAAVADKAVPFVQAHLPNPQQQQQQQQPVAQSPSIFGVAAPHVVPTQVPGGGHAPKASLYQIYGRKPRRKQLSADDYLSWNNGGRPHELKFAAIFQDPVTGELFPAGRFGDPKFYVVEKMINHKGKEVEVVWYTKKALAEHGAAARCFDCIHYRETLQAGGNVAQLVRMGTDPPYTRDEAPVIPPVPPMIAQAMEENMKRIQGSTPAPQGY